MQVMHRKKERRYRVLTSLNYQGEFTTNYMIE